jgi:fibronectin-binding autotransporter adhesin
MIRLVKDFSHFLGGIFMQYSSKTESRLLRKLAKSRPLAALIISGAVAAAMPQTSDALNLSWTNPAGGAFEDGTNWSSGFHPGLTDNATFSLTGITPYTVTLSTNAFSSGVTIGGAPLILSLGGFQYAGANISSLTAGGTLAFNNGTFQTQNLYLTSPSTCTIGSGANVSVGTFEYVGRQGSGTASLTQTAGANSITGFVNDINGNAALGLAISSDATASGSYTLSGGSLSVTYDESIGEAGTGTLTQTNGDNNCAADLILGHVNPGTGTYNLSGGTVEAAILAIGDFIKTKGTFNLSGTGALTISGVEGIGSNNNSSPSTVANFNQTAGSNIAGSMALGNAANASGAYTLSGGTLSVAGALTLTGTNSSFTQTGGTATFGSATNAGNVLVGGMIGNQPAPTLTISADYAQTAGTTQVDGTLAIGAGHNFNLSGGTVKGTGTISGSINNTGGIVSPGDSPGTLTITGNYIQGAAGELDILIDGYSPGTQFDVLSVNGMTTLNGSLHIIFGDGFTPQLKDQFTFLNSGGISGAFSSVNSAYPMNFSFSGGNASVTVVPEPSTFILAALGMLLLPRRRRGKRAIVSN